jgi:protein-disulfide isomerase
MHCWQARYSLHRLIPTTDVLLLHGVRCVSAARHIDMLDCKLNDQPAVQTATGSSNDTSAAAALDAAKLGIDVYANITQDALETIAVSAQGSSSPNRRHVPLLSAEATTGSSIAKLSHLPNHRGAGHH